MAPLLSLKSLAVSISIIGAALLEVVSGIPVHAKRASIVSSPDDLLEEYDFIVVGAGTAGLTVGDRLSESGEYTVLVVEYGYLDSSHSINAIHVPDVKSGPPDQYSTASRMYNITSVPQPYLRNRTETVAAGALVGGSAAVNGMIFDRGSAEDYDAWVWAAGEQHQRAFAKEWGWDNIYPWFKKSARLDVPTPEMVEKYDITYDLAAYSENGPIHASYQPYQFPKQKLLWETFKAVPGVETPPEHADGHAYGLIWVPGSINFATQRRSSGKTAHIDAEGAASSRPNFHLLPAHRVNQVVLEEQTTKGGAKTFRATGVRLMPRGYTRTVPCGQENADPMFHVKAKEEVIVSAGTLHTPQVLERSGIGARDVLRDAGVQLKVDLPGVGWNLQDHMYFNMEWKYNTPVFPMPGDLDKNATFAAEAQAEWDASKSGPYTSRYNSGAFLSLDVISNKSAEIAAKILAQDVASVLPAGLDPTLVAGVKQMHKVVARQYASGKSAIVEIPLGAGQVNRIVSLKVLSRGSIHIGRDDDWDYRGDKEPVLDYRTFSNPIDAEVVAEILKFVRRVMASDPLMSTLSPVEVLPGPDVQTDEEIASWFLDRISPGRAHPVGTAALGPRELGGVLRPDLTVYGTRGLSVADNSVMPIIVSAHTASTAYAIGEKAADLARRRAKGGQC